MSEMQGGLLMGAIVGFFIGVMVMASQIGSANMDVAICQRTIQFQLDKTPEEVQTLINTEKKREGR